uniref:ARS2 domain-containing protein n=1 Tax=Echinostoma caproni TaxID=27848 RepID=A0A183AEU3_9TREM
LDGDESDKDETRSATCKAAKSPSPGVASEKPNGWRHRRSSNGSVHSPGDRYNSPTPAAVDDESAEHSVNDQSHTAATQDDKSGVAKDGNENSAQSDGRSDLSSPKDDEDDVPTPTTAEAPDGVVPTEGGLSPSVSSVLLGTTSDTKVATGPGLLDDGASAQNDGNCVEEGGSEEEALLVYPMEDLMPHRCGILHARGDRGLNPTLPSGRAPTLVFSQREIDDHLRNFEMKLRSLIDVPPQLTEDVMVKLGMRDPEKVAEDFIEANIQKRTGKKKPFKVVWVCPLSDKKFREPIFVRKHIFNKHMDKVEAAKKDNAVFFNNYLRDPRRPSLPEAPYHIAQQYYNSSSSTGGNYRGPRGAGRMAGSGPGVGSNYRSNYRGVNSANAASLLSAAGSVYSRGAGSFQDYYDIAAQQQQQQQAMAAVAAAAAAALCPNANPADLYALAAASAGNSRGPAPGRRGQRGNSPGHAEYSGRSFYSGDGRRRQPSNYGGSRYAHSNYL